MNVLKKAPDSKRVKSKVPNYLNKRRFKKMEKITKEKSIWL